MGFRFFKRVQLAPGVTLNLSKGGASVSVGPRGAKVTVGTSGAQLTLGVPGTGLYWTGKIGDFGGLLGGDEEKTEKGKTRARAVPDSAEPETTARPAEEAWVEGMEALSEEKHADAVARLKVAWEGREELRGARSKVSATIPVTPEITLALVPDRKGAGLAYAEGLQALGRMDEAVAVLTVLRAEADAPVVRTALAEIELQRGHAEAALEVCGRSRDPVVALYRARALLAAGRAEAALAEVARLRSKVPDALKDDLDEIEAAARE